MVRVSNNMNYDQVKGNIGKNRSEASDLQNQAATQKRITKPSDDPVGAARTLGLRTDGANNEQFQKNSEVAKNFLNYTESALGDLSEVLMRAKELAISQSSDASASAATRIAVATEIDQLFNDSVNIANRKLGERFIFGGFKTTHSPFDHVGKYRGDEGAIKIEVAKGVFTSVNLPGERSFLGRNSAIAEIPDERKGATTPNYPAAPHQQEDVPVRGPASVTEDAPSRAPASVDEHGNDVATKRKFEQLEADEKVTPVEEKKSGESIFNVMRALSDGLRANDTLAVQDTLERIDGALEQVVLLRSQVGSRVSSLENTQVALGKNKLDDAALLSSIEDADAFEVFTDITKNENALKATLQTSGKLIQPSLLDFLR